MPTVSRVGSQPKDNRNRSEWAPRAEQSEPGRTATPCRRATRANWLASPAGIPTQRYAPPSGCLTAKSGRLPQFWKPLHQPGGDELCQEGRPQVGDPLGLSQTGDEMFWSPNPADT